MTFSISIAKTAAGYVAEEHIWVNEAGQPVPAGSPDAARLAVASGEEITKAEAEALGLSGRSAPAAAADGDDEDGGEVEDDAAARRKAARAARNKQRRAARNKQAAGTETEDDSE